MELSDLQDFPQRIGLPCQRFILFLAADFSATAADRYAIAERILDAGCVYLCTWGPSCEFMHDLMDEAIVARELERPSEGTVMTTWHAEESLSDAVEFALTSAHPDDSHAAGCDAIVLAVVSHVTSSVDLETATMKFIR